MKTFQVHNIWFMITMCLFNMTLDNRYTPILAYYQFSLCASENSQYVYCTSVMPVGG